MYNHKLGLHKAQTTENIHHSSLNHDTSLLAHPPSIKYAYMIANESQKSANLLLNFRKCSQCVLMLSP